MTLVFDVDRSSGREVLAHLRQCDQTFVPSLSSRLDLTAYADRLATRATRFEAWEDGRLVGLVACYLNDLERRVGFITSVSVLAEARGRGLAGALMAHCLERARSLGFTAVELEVAPTNAAALALYRRCGFKSTTEDGAPMTTMNLSLETAT